jgi:hypothetical protein
LNFDYSRKEMTSSTPCMTLKRMIHVIVARVVILRCKLKGGTRLTNNHYWIFMFLLLAGLTF